MITDQLESHHEYGQGGKSVRVTTLQKGEQVLLMSVAVLPYTTYSDDSEDHEVSVGKSARTYLMEPEQLATEVFRSLNS